LAYTGIVVPIAMGRGGLHTDDDPGSIPPTDLIVANNVRLWGNQIEKDTGSARLLQDSAVAAASGGIIAAFDFWPTNAITDRRVIILGADAIVYSLNPVSGVKSVVVLAGGGAATVLDVTRGSRCMFVLGGSESAGRKPKLFLFTGMSKVQVIQLTAGVIVRADLASPSADWAANFPTFGFVHKNRMWAFGNSNDPNRVYGSSLIAATGVFDHENFVGAAPTDVIQNSIASGDGENLVSAYIYKRKVIFLKQPFGLFVWEDSDPDITKWSLSKVQGGIGGASEHSVVQVIDDLLFKNTTGSISSLAATASFGDVEAGDTLAILNIEQFIRDTFKTSSYTSGHSLYYGEKKVCYFTYRSTDSSLENRMLCFTVGAGDRPRATINTKDQPNCLLTFRDTTLIDRPLYGSADGFLYQMDKEDRNVNGVAYLGEFQTPHMDFGFADSKSQPKDIGGKNKNFDFIELTYVSTGAFDVLADVFIDGNYTETVTFPMDGDALLADEDFDTRDFILDDNDDVGSSIMSEDTRRVVRSRIHGMGVTLSVRIYNNGLNQNFKISALTFSFRLSGEQQSKG